MFATLNSLDVVCFHYFKIDGNFYNVYFETVGAHSGGEGNIRISKTPLLFPFIEKTIFNEHAVMWDYSQDRFEDEKVDQNKIMRQTIIDKLTNK